MRESYEAIVKLWGMESHGTDNGKGEEGKKFCKEIGISTTTLSRALNYIKDKQQDPDAVEKFMKSLRTTRQRNSSNDKMIGETAKRLGIIFHIYPCVI